MNLQDSLQTKGISDTDFIIYNNILFDRRVSSTDRTYPTADLQQRKMQIRRWRQQLAYLKSLPHLKQRTLEWYEARKSRLTASDLEEAISEGNLRLAKKKAGVIADTTNYISIAPLKWGTMFEAMATRCYSQERQDIEVHEFGLLLDPELDHFGASPDGINDLGIMVEIKCPYSREIIDNSIPYKYYMQIQGQLAVCKLEECDYIECEFKTYDSHTCYIDDICNTHNNAVTKHGIIAEYKNKLTEEYYYLYSEPYLTAAAAYEDIKKQMSTLVDKDNNLLFLKLTPWRLQKINVQRVTFSPTLWSETVPKINAFWEKVEQCRTLPKEEAVQKQKKFTFIEDDADGD
jgi:putative phage-type endonuclease